MTTTLETPTRPSTAGLLRGEWIKARSLRSTWYVLAGSLVGMVLLGLLFTSTAGDGGPGGNGGGPPSVDFAQPLTLALAGYNLAQLALGVLGVLLVTGEYTSGTIRSTFAATPRRWPVVAAKAAVLGGVVLVTSTVAALASYAVGSAVTDGMPGLGDDGVLRVVLGTALYLTAITLLGSALGWLLRSTAGAVATLFGLVFLLPILGNLLPADWGPDVVRWLPSSAGGSLLRLTTTADQFAPWTGFAVLVGYVAVGLGAAVWRLGTRDA
ncbi:ABC-type transport system involved in multi-copper enzyme maturation, permease component [Klenkia soli]|uniref:ABC-type transport system involved in multi-copper enzyme maturation, permease component n=1 Tax=Klenkia soli TaxID=1052260 RepID=A0A1H0J941_9ACTN|nr:ABC transporter permease subunit [Klenkia soli]SDO40236.1 ABC-type transport system involved in multi-copper enzyme maturation, permease component [Klenkia soli]